MNCWCRLPTPSLQAMRRARCRGGSSVRVRPRAGRWKPFEARTYPAKAHRFRLEWFRRPASLIAVLKTLSVRPSAASERPDAPPQCLWQIARNAACSDFTQTTRGFDILETRGGRDSEPLARRAAHCGASRETCRAANDRAEGEGVLAG